jgi:hypothetical protein
MYPQHREQLQGTCIEQCTNRCGTGTSDHLPSPVGLLRRASSTRPPTGWGTSPSVCGWASGAGEEESPCPRAPGWVPRRTTAHLERGAGPTTHAAGFPVRLLRVTFQPSLLTVTAQTRVASRTRQRPLRSWAHFGHGCPEADGADPHEVRADRAVDRPVAQSISCLGPLVMNRSSVRFR